jgi:hypothetical protein
VTAGTKKIRCQDLMAVKNYSIQADNYIIAGITYFDLELLIEHDFRIQLRVVSLQTEV